MVSMIILSESELKLSHSIIDCVMVSELASSVAFHGFEPRSCKAKNYKFGMCCFSTQQASLRRKRKDRLTRNQISVSEGSGMSTHDLLPQ